MKDRFDYCPDVDGTWAVIDLATGQPAFFGGHPVMMIDLERAEAITLLLNGVGTASPDAIGTIAREESDARAAAKLLGAPERRPGAPD